MYIYITIFHIISSFSLHIIDISPMNLYLPLILSSIKTHRAPVPSTKPCDIPLPSTQSSWSWWHHWAYVSPAVFVGWSLKGTHEILKVMEFWSSIPEKFCKYLDDWTHDIICFFSECIYLGTISLSFSCSATVKYQWVHSISKKVINHLSYVYEVYGLYLLQSRRCLQTTSPTEKQPRCLQTQGSSRCFFEVVVQWTRVLLYKNAKSTNFQMHSLSMAIQHESLIRT